MSEPTPADCIADIEEVAALYAREATRVRRLVGLGVTASGEVVEDACQTAWLRLLRHHARVRRAGALRWVIRVAQHDVYRQLGRDARTRPVEDVDAIPERASTPDLLAEIAEARERLAAVGALPARQAQLVWLRGLGFSYAEMAGATGQSRRTIERQLMRAGTTLDRRRAA